jgi:sugar lactone lactonase YvrE
LSLIRAINHPVGIAVDLWGTLYIADQQNAVVRKMNTVGEVSTLAGSPGQVGNADGFGPGARFGSPSAVAVDANGTVYVADGTNSIRTISPSGFVSTLTAVSANPALLASSVGSSGPNFPLAVAVGSRGTLYFTDNTTVQIMRTSTAGVPALRLSQVAGQVVLSWPASAFNYTLETRNSLSAESAWTPVAGQPAIIGCNLVLTNELQTPAAFYRLHSR